MDNIEQRKKLANILKRAQNTAKPDKCMCAEKHRQVFVIHI